MVLCRYYGDRVWRPRQQLCGDAWQHITDEWRQLHLADIYCACRRDAALGVVLGETCPDTVAFDWARATLKDNTTGTTTVLISKQCQTTNGWVQAVTGLVGGHVYTLTLVSHDDNFSGDPTYTLYDDIVIQ